MKSKASYWMQEHWTESQQEHQNRLNKTAVNEGLETVLGNLR